MRKQKVLSTDTQEQIFLIPEVENMYLQNALERVKYAWEMHQHLGSGKPMLLAFSGGKDSVCVYGVCKLVADELHEDFDKMFYMQYNITNVDPPELVQFVKKEFPQVHLHHPKKTMWQLIIDKHMPPIRTARYCCAELKEISKQENGFTLTGVRHAESSKRANRGAIEIISNNKTERIQMNDNDDRRWEEYCMQKRAHVCNPIIDWSDQDVWHFIKSQNLPYCKLYDEGWTRLGCIGCPLACDEEREREFERWPNYEKQYVRTFQRMLDESIKRGGYETKSLTPFLDGQDVFDWWMRRPAFKERHQEELEKDMELFNESEV